MNFCNISKGRLILCHNLLSPHLYNVWDKNVCDIVITEFFNLGGGNTKLVASVSLGFLSMKKEDSIQGQVLYGFGFHQKWCWSKMVPFIRNV